MPLQSKGMANEKSRIKMRVFTTNKEENKCWYSPAAENKKSNSEIIEGMKTRFSNNIAKGNLVINARINCIIFYDAFTGNELQKFKQ